MEDRRKWLKAVRLIDRRQMKEDRRQMKEDR
jgi:hypothetical protein